MMIEYFFEKLQAMFERYLGVMIDVRINEILSLF
jgi:hypothetical protein